MKRLENKVAVITGGADGLGRAAAIKFCAEGATVIIWDMNEEKGLQTVLEIENSGGKVFFAKVNTASYTEVEAATKVASDKFGRIDILINNAGITRDASIKKMTPDMWQQVIDVNLTGVFNCAKCISELGRKGVTVNAVAPGFIATEMVKKMPENVLKAMEEKVPLGRLGAPEEIASAYLFLASDEAAYINGATLSVDGGITI